MSRVSAIAAHRRQIRGWIEDLSRLVGDRTPYVTSAKLVRPGHRDRQVAVAYYGGRGVAWNGRETCYVYAIGTDYRGKNLTAYATESGLRKVPE